MKSAFEGLVLVTPPRGDNFRSEYVKGLRVELALCVHHRAEHRQTPDVAVVQYLDNLCPLVAEAEIGLVEQQRAFKRVECVEER
jgi:hypothetical protein